MIQKLTMILTFIGGLGALVVSDVQNFQAGVTALTSGQIMGGLQDFCLVVGATAGFFHLHFKFNLFGLSVDTGNN